MHLIGHAASFTHSGSEVGRLKLLIEVSSLSSSGSRFPPFSLHGIIDKRLRPPSILLQRIMILTHNLKPILFIKPLTLLCRENTTLFSIQIL
jgi:hypothetical protein